MKRVKESFFREHPLWNNTEGCSGAKEFEGEDLGNNTSLNKLLLYAVYIMVFLIDWSVWILHKRHVCLRSCGIVNGS